MYLCQCLRDPEHSEALHVSHLQIVDFLESVAQEHGSITGVANLIGNMCIKPAHLTSDEEVGPHTSGATSTE